VGDQNPTDTDIAKKIRLLSVLGIQIALGALAAILASQTSGWLAAVGVCGLILMSAGAVGAAFGFLFALPRVLTKDEPLSSAAAEANSKSQPSLKKRLLGSNTNLERVSDWLTTMIVGVGLTQIASVNGALLNFRVFLSETAKVFPGPHGYNAGILPSVGPMILVFGLVLGFLFVYLYTRVILSVLLNQVETVLESRLTGAAAEAVKNLAPTLSGIAENRALSSVFKSDEPSVYEGIELMGSLLYQPGRYQDVIDLGAKLSVTPATQRAEYWLYNAAAFGQKHHALLATPGADLESARENALDCARRAVRIDPSMKSRLWFISDPDGDDDDLSDFRNDEEFLKIVGKWSKPSRV
jgi:hypothetical protein